MIGLIPEVVSNITAELGEGPSWDAEKKVLYWVDISGGIVYAHTPNDPNDEVVQRVKSVSSVVPRRGGLGLVLTSQHGIFGLDLKTKVLVPMAEEVETDRERNRFNDGKCDPAGRFWAGTLNGLRDAPSGALYALEKNHRLRKVLPDVTVSNGMGWSPDNKTMYHIDSPTRKVSAFDYALGTGEIVNRRTVVDFSQAQQPGNPDGMTVDEEGMIWVAHWGGARVTRWDPSSGRLLDTIAVPADQTSSCCFGGDDLDELYITSARHQLDPKVLAAKPLGGSLFMAKVGVRGLPTHAFDG
jgi:sugar lactone lactonase YvrE